MSERERQTRAFYRDWVDLYDLMIDWDKRLDREGPAIESLLGETGGRRVLDVACGTGRHIAWLANRGANVTGADVSPEMLARAAAALKGLPHGPLVEWSMADSPPAELGAPFDLVLCLGNSFPHVIGEAAVAATLGNFRRLLAPDGKLAIGLKALALQASAGQPYLPLAKRRDGEHDLFFVRFYDFQLEATPPTANFHLVIVGPTHPALADGPHHTVNTLRAWRPEELRAASEQAGLVNVRLCSDLTGRPWDADAGPDLFVLADAPTD